MRSAIELRTYSHLSRNALDVLTGTIRDAPSSVRLNIDSVSAPRNRFRIAGALLGRSKDTCSSKATRVRASWPAYRIPGAPTSQRNARRASALDCDHPRWEEIGTGNLIKTAEQGGARRCSGAQARGDWTLTVQTGRLPWAHITREREKRVAAAIAAQAFGGGSGCLRKAAKAEVEKGWLEKTLSEGRSLDGRVSQPRTSSGLQLEIDRQSRAREKIIMREQDAATQMSLRTIQYADENMDGGLLSGGFESVRACGPNSATRGGRKWNQGNYWKEHESMGGKRAGLVLKESRDGKKESDTRGPRRNRGVRLGDATQWGASEGREDTRIQQRRRQNMGDEMRNIRRGGIQTGGSRGSLGSSDGYRSSSAPRVRQYEYRPGKTRYDRERMEHRVHVGRQRCGLAMRCRGEGTPPEHLQDCSKLGEYSRGHLGVASRTQTPRTDEVSGALSRGANAPWKQAGEQNGWGRESDAEILDIVPLACNVGGFRLQRASQNGMSRGIAGHTRAHTKSEVKEAARSPSSLCRIWDEGRRLAAPGLVGTGERMNDVEARRLKFGARRQYGVRTERTKSVGKKEHATVEAPLNCLWPAARRSGRIDYAWPAVRHRMIRMTGGAAERMDSADPFLSAPGWVRSCFAELRQLPRNTKHQDLPRSALSNAWMSDAESGE
ncbi:hypothetical protein K438DRAFT_1774178 [Mycena galopus ATCC 62051]|nr:hypothetical protein K438DRAFT_1774178 [Mycena galopus ATCC 62051]